MKSPRTRIAPTPSGYLHAGNGFNFLVISFLAARTGGKVILRIDDLDGERVRPEYVEDVFESLAWLGIPWQEGPRDAAEFRTSWSQHRRTARYNTLLTELKQDGHLYACACSRAETDDCTCHEIAIPFDRPDVRWRLRLPTTCMVDLPGLGSSPQRVDLAHLMDDPVLRRRNGAPAYQIASLADDVDHQITLIVRGEDLLASSACQFHLARLLGLTSFLHVLFVHHPLLTDEQGNKLSKSEGATSLRSMRMEGRSADHLRMQAEEFVASLVDQGL